MPVNKPRVVGKVVMKPLASVRPNSWNPNSMTPFEKESLKAGLLQDGWLAAQALLVWGTNELGEDKNLIIDGEHRWYGATELGFVDGPMVFLYDLSEAEAKALTVKMDAKRGKFKQDALAILLKEIQYELPEADQANLALGMGIPEDELMRMLAFEPEIIQPLAEPEHRAPIEAAPDASPQMQQGHVTLVQLFFNKEQHTAFMEAANKVAAKAKTKNISETLLAAVQAWAKVLDAQ